MKKLMIVFAVFGASLPATASVMPTQHTSCSVEAWIWDTFFGGLGCHF